MGKSYLACALAHQACRERFRALYFYAPKLFRALNLAQADGSLIRLLKRLARVDLLVIDDWGMTPLTPDQYRLFLEILDDRQGTGATLITSQLGRHPGRQGPGCRAMSTFTHVGVARESFQLFAKPSGRDSLRLRFGTAVLQDRTVCE